MQSLKTQVAHTAIGRNNPQMPSQSRKVNFGVLKDHLYNVALKRAKKKKKGNIMMEGVRNSRSAKG